MATVEAAPTDVSLLIGDEHVSAGRDVVCDGVGWPRCCAACCSAAIDCSVGRFPSAKARSNSDRLKGHETHLEPRIDRHVLRRWARDRFASRVARRWGGGAIGARERNSISTGCQEFPTRWREACACWALRWIQSVRRANRWCTDRDVSALRGPVSAMAAARRFLVLVGCTAALEG
jgi:hypothetical protein